MSITLISAPHSGAGKTTITLGILRALSRRGMSLRAAKSGPDYIDPKFHTAACGQPSVNLDAWAMPQVQLHHLAHGPDNLLIEGAMGLFDGAGLHGVGASADLARLFDASVILVVDTARMAHSIAPLVAGFSNHSADIRVTGLILNRVGSDKHDAMLRHALADAGAPLVIGSIRRHPDLAQPSRHLGLVQAEEHADLDGWIDTVADHMEAQIDLDAIFDGTGTAQQTEFAIKPPAQRIAVAKDVAFAFSYPHLLSGWQSAGAEITTFSPLNDDPVPDSDFIYLPGGYPELHAGKIAQNTRFLSTLRTISQTTDIYGECGGYMTLGNGLTDANGIRHEMAGLLPLETSFQQRKLHLGYRKVTASHGRFKGSHNTHEFHYARTLQAKGQPLFQAQDVDGNSLPDMGLIKDRVSGSFAHLIASM